MTEPDSAQEVLQAAQQLLDQNPDWVTFFREVFGLKGLVRRKFPPPVALAEFERTESYAQLQRMLAGLRRRQAKAPAPQELTKVITVRLPDSLHNLLRNQADEYHTSVNQLCISKLLQPVEQELVPTDY